MTDVLSGVGAALDDQFTSHEETKPKAAPPTPESVTCHFCPETFDGGARFVKRGLHEKRKHPDEWAAAKAGLKPKKKTAKKQPAPRAPSTKVTGPVTKRRIAAADTITSVLGMAAQLVVRVDAPTGRALKFSAPATGEAVDTLVAGTIVDRLVLQKVAGAADKWEKVGGVIAFPVLIAVISRNPALFEPLEDQLRAATVDVITASIPTLEKRKNRERKATQALARLGEVDERYANAADPIRLVLEDIFGAQIVARESDGEGV